MASKNLYIWLACKTHRSDLLSIVSVVITVVTILFLFALSILILYQRATTVFVGGHLVVGATGLAHLVRGH